MSRIDSTPVGTARKSAFTLVELLVVIGIIALLISILLPSLNRARQSAQMVVCASNLRQIGLANALYVQDNNGRTVVGNMGSGATLQLWFWLLRPYIGKEDKSGLTTASTVSKVFLCPTDETQGGLQHLGGLPSGLLPNAALSGRSYALAIYAHGRKITSLKRTSEMLFATDSEWWKIGSNYIGPSREANGSPASWGNQFDPTFPRHRHPKEAMNLLMLDSHVETAPVKSLLDIGGSHEKIWYPN